jgi:hypothetical protein
MEFSMTTPNPLNALKIAVLQALLTPITNINAAFVNLEATPTAANAAEQLAIIKGQELTLALELPALIPTLEGDVIAAGAAEVQVGLGDIIAEISAQIAAAQAPAASSKK